MRAHVITVSDRSAAGQREDRSGPRAAEFLRAKGFACEVVVVPDGIEPVEVAIRSSVEDGADLVITSGGTGVGPRDLTPEATRRVVDAEIPGISELLRSTGARATPYAVLGRGVAGMVRPTDGHQGALVVNLPGSPGAVGEGLAVLLPLVGHVVDQLRGGDH